MYYIKILYIKSQQMHINVFLCIIKIYRGMLGKEYKILFNIKGVYVYFSPNVAPIPYPAFYVFYITYTFMLVRHLLHCHTIEFLSLFSTSYIKIRHQSMKNTNKNQITKTLFYKKNNLKFTFFIIFACNFLHFCFAK